MDSPCMLRARVALAPLGNLASLCLPESVCYRYDLQIRYLPEDFMESLKEDRTTLLYFYQQVKSSPVYHGTLNAVTSILFRGNRKMRPSFVEGFPLRLFLMLPARLELLGGQVPG